MICQSSRFLLITISDAIPRSSTPTLVYLHSGYDTASITTQESQIAFIATLFKSTSPSLPLQPYSRSILRIVRVALNSDQPALRVLVCAVLGSPTLGDLDVEEEPLRPCDEVMRLVGDRDVMVRSAACRAFGILVKSPKYSLVSSIRALWSRESILTRLESIGWLPEYDCGGSSREIPRWRRCSSFCELVARELLRCLDSSVRLIHIHSVRISLIWVATSGPSRASIRT